MEWHSGKTAYISSGYNIQELEYQLQERNNYKLQHINYTKEVTGELCSC